MKPLTPRQQEVVDMMKSFHTQHGYYPILREIGRAINLRSEGSVSRLIDELIDKGYAKKVNRKHRGISLTENVA